MSDQVLKVGVDARGARQGASQYSAAIDKMTKSLRAYEAAADKINKGSGGSNQFRQLARDLNGLSRTRISPTLGRELNAINSAISGMRVSGSSIRNFKTLMRELSKVQINPRSATNIGKITQAMSGFKAPSAAQVRNMQAFGMAIANIRLPRNTAAIAAGIERIGNAAGRSALQMSAFTRAMSGGNISRFTRSLSGVRGAATSAHAGITRLSGGFRGLENAMSASYQLGSQLRVLFGSLTIGSLTKDVYDSSIAFERFKTTLAVTSQNQEEVAKQIDFTEKIANKFGISLNTIYQSYGKFATAVRLSGKSIEQTQFIFEQFSGAMRVMGLNAERQGLVFLALEQIFSKGRVSSEELKRQLGEQIPGVFELMAKVIQETTGDSSANLQDMLKKGVITSDAVILLAEKMKDIFGPQWATALARADTAIGRLANQWIVFQREVGDAGVMDALNIGARRLTETMKGDQFKKFAQELGSGLGYAIDRVTDAAVWLVKNLDTVKRALRGIIGLQIGKSLVSMFSMATQAAVGFATRVGSIGSLLGGAFALGIAGVAAFHDSVVTLGTTSVTVGGIVQQAWSELRDWAITVASDIAVNLGSKSTEETVRMWIGAADAIIKLLRSILGVAYEVGQGIGRFLSRPINAAIYASEGEWRKAAGEIGKLNPFYEIAETGKNIGFRIASELDKPSYFGGLIERAGEAEKAQKSVFESAEEERKKQLEKIKKESEEMAKAVSTLQNGGRDLKPVDEGSTTSGKSATEKAAKTAANALRDYKEQVEQLDAALKQGIITQAQYNELQTSYAKKLEEVQDPYGALLRSMKEEINLKIMGGRASRVEEEYRQRVNDLMEKGVALTDQQKEKLRQLIEMRDKLGDTSSLQGFIAGIEDIDSALDRVTTQALSGLSDQISEMVVEGKADFQSLAKSILKEFIKIGVNQVYKWLFGGFMGGQMQQSAPNINISGTGGVAGGPIGQQVIEAGVVQVNGPVDAATLAGQYAQYRPGTVPLGAAAKSGRLGSVSPLSDAAFNSRFGPSPLGDTAFNSRFGGAASAMNGFTFSKFSEASYDTISNQLMSRLQSDLGITANQAGGIVSNLAHETGGFRKLQEMAPMIKGSRGGYGLAQWTGPRRREYESFTKSQGMAVDDPEANYQFLLKELRGSESGSLKALRDTSSLRDATVSFQDKFERPGIPHTSSRLAYADKTMAAYSTQPTQMAATGIDSTTTGSIQQANQALQQTGQQMQTLAQQTQTATQAVQAEGQQKQVATQQKQMASQTELMTTQQSTLAQQQNAMAVQQAGTQAQTAAPSFQTLSTSVQQAGTNAQTASANAGMASGSLGSFGQGITGLLGPLSQAIPGLGQFGGAIMQLIQMMSMGGGGGGLLGGLFKEGGLSGNPVASAKVSMAAFANAPRFSEGTTSTGSGMGTGRGMPAVLHPNEAVIPLSRGRSIPIESNDRGAGLTRGNASNVSVSMNINGVTDVNGFKRSQKQIEAKMAAAAQRASSRNN